MQEFPRAAFLAKDLRHSQSPLRRVLLTAQTHFFLALNRHREAHVPTDFSTNIFDLQLGPAVLVLRRRPIVTRAYLAPTPFITAKPAQYRGVVTLRGILLPESRITGDETRLRLFPSSQERRKLDSPVWVERTCALTNSEGTRSASKSIFFMADFL